MIKMFTQWRINKLKIKIAGIKSEIKCLIALESNSPHYIDRSLRALQDLSKSKEELSILEAKRGD